MVLDGFVQVASMVVPVFERSAKPTFRYSLVAFGGLWFLNGAAEPPRSNVLRVIFVPVGG